MMDLQEAIASLEHYISKLDHQCELFRVTTGLEDSIENPEAGHEVRVMDQLKATERDSLILDIIVSREFAIRAHHFIYDPLALSKLIDAQVRLSVACQSASALIERHEQKAGQNQNEREGSSGAKAGPLHEEGPAPRE